MIDNGIVFGNKEIAVPLIINYDDVYVHTDIKWIETEKTYQYHEYIYTRDEYTVMSNNTKDEQIHSNSSNIEDLTVMLSELVGSE